MTTTFPRARLASLALIFALAAFSSVHAQQPVAKVPRVGVLLFGTPESDPNLPALVGGLRDLGYVDGRNVVIEYRGADGHPERARELALEVTSRKPDVIVVLGGDLVPFVKDATKTIPVVMLTSNDPVEAGIVDSFARPGGNLTGVAFVSSETAGKRLQFVKEAIPSLTRVAVLWNPDHPDGEFRDIQAAARRLGIDIQSLEVRRPEDFDRAFQAATRERTETLMVVTSRLMNINRARIVDFASRQRVPLVSGWGHWANAGGFLSYGPDLDVLARRAATHVDKILRGAKPSDLAVEQPSVFELVVNLKTARQLGLTVPPALVARADHVIQ